MWLGSLLPSGASGRMTSTSFASVVRMASRFSCSRAAMRVSVVRTFTITASGAGASAPCPPAGKLSPPTINTTSRGTAEERARERVQIAALGSLERTTPRDDLVDEDDSGDDEEQVNQRPTDVDRQKPSQPQDDQNDDQCPEHRKLLGLTTGTESPLAASMGPTRPLCNGLDQTRRSRPAVVVPAASSSLHSALLRGRRALVTPR